MSVVVRTAGASDIDALIELNAVVQSLHARLEPAHFRGDADVKELRAFFAAALEADGSQFLLAEVDRAAVGYVWFELQERPATPFTTARRRLYVQHLAVSGEVRRRGVASALMNAVEAAAHGHGVTRVVLDAWASNDDAHRFFQAAGFAPFNIVLAKTLA